MLPPAAIVLKQTVSLEAWTNVHYLLMRSSTSLLLPFITASLCIFWYSLVFFCVV